MAYSIVSLFGDGTSNVFTISFGQLGFLSRDDVTVEVDGELDGVGNPVTREIEWITDGVIRVLGSIIPSGAPFRVLRTVNKEVLTNDFENGAAITEQNLDNGFSQSLMAVQEILDGRIDGFGEEFAADLFADSQAQVALAAIEADRATTEATRAVQEADRAASFGDVLVGIQFLDKFPSRLALSTATVDGAVTFVETQGYSSQGDGGSGSYRKVVSEPWHELKVQSADGAWWELVEYHQINEKQAGGVGDGVSDDTAAIQAIIDYVLYRPANHYSALPMEVVLIGPLLKTSDTIHVGYGVAYHSVHVRGVSYKHRAEGGFAGTAILATFSDRPIINIQAARETTVSDLWLEGNLDFTGFDFTVHDATLEASWDAKGGDGRYNPYAGITVGAYCGVRPGTSYPDVVYPAWMGAVAQYGKELGSNVTIARVGVRKVNVGFCWKPSDNAFNDDFGKMDNCVVETCKYGVSVGHHQSRNVEVSNLTGQNIWTVFVSNVHGVQQGRFSGVMYNCSFGGFIGRLFEFGSTSVLGETIFIALYVEGLNRIGDFLADTSAESSIIFDSCTFGFTHNTALGVPANILGGATSSDILFRGCRFQGAPSMYSLLPSNVHMEHHRVYTSERDSATLPLYVAHAHATLAGGIGLDPLSPFSHIIRFKGVNTETGVLGGDVSTKAEEHFLAGRTGGLSMYQRAVSKATERGGAAQPFNRRYFDRTVGTANHFASAVQTDRVLVLTFDNSAAELTDHDAFINAFSPGDVIRHDVTGTYWFIRSRVGGVITAELQNNYRTNPVGGATEFVTPITFSGARLQFINGRYFTTTYKTFLDFTSGSAVGDAGRIDGYSAFIPAEILPGDYINLHEAEDRILLNAEQKVDTVSGDGASITFSGNAREDAVRKKAIGWIKRPLPNV